MKKKARILELEQRLRGQAEIVERLIMLGEHQQCAKRKALARLAFAQQTLKGMTENEGMSPYVRQVATTALNILSGEQADWPVQCPACGQGFNEDGDGVKKKATDEDGVEFYGEPL